jgi:hypothetical protein
MEHTKMGEAVKPLPHHLAIKQADRDQPTDPSCLYGLQCHKEQRRRGSYQHLAWWFQ